MITEERRQELQEIIGEILAAVQVLQERLDLETTGRARVLKRTSKGLYDVHARKYIRTTLALVSGKKLKQSRKEEGLE